MNERRIPSWGRAIALVAAVSLVNVATATQVTMKGSPITLGGQTAVAGTPAPEFTALDAAFQPVKLSDFRGRIVVISAVPSLDTPVCSLQTKRFHEELGNLPANVTVVTISMDLPFAQKRFCGQQDMAGMVVVSDSARREFGEAYGVQITERGLLARSVFIVDGDGVLRYVQIVPEVTQEPDYDAALAAVRKIAN